MATLPRGKAAWKSRLAGKVLVDPADMRVRREVIAEITAARAEGRKVALVSASAHDQVAMVADRLGLFDEAYGTGGGIAGGRNLSGQTKADFLAGHFGPGGFDYIGDSWTDAPVWAAARKAIVAGGDRAALQAASTHPQSLALDGEAAKPTALLAAIRPHQWMKNVLIFIPILASQQFGETSLAILAFIAFCLVASSVPDQRHVGSEG